MRMSRHLLLPLSLACIATTAFAANGRLRERFAERMQARLAAHENVAVPPGVRRIADLAYGRDPAQRLDAYVPEHPDGRVIVMVHGGGWRRGDKAMASVVDHKLAHWGAHGDVFVSVDYQLLPQAGPLQQAGDVAMALVYVQAHAREWGADPANVVLMGHSAGAHLVALLSANPDLAKNAAPWRASVALDSAALDVPALMRSRHPSLYDDAFGRDPAYWRAASPQQRLTPKAPPMLLVCSSERRDSCPAAREFATSAHALGVRAQVLPQAHTHGEINADLGLP
ncbi:MAG TPA: alpha/beta hydrolase, partial [Lysobacter sp.]|nr:alpha/beta hydrolase [Lysobacter sp.]